MASFQIALAWMLNFEDSTHQYATVPDSPPGAFAIAGVNSAAWPSDFATINALTPDLRASAVAQFYKEEFWTPWLAQIESDDVAKRVFDAGVNMGIGTAAELLQGATNDCGTDLDVDGHLGPLSVAAVNCADPACLVAAFCARRAAHYDHIVADNPDDAQYLDGWLARAKA